MHLQCPRRPITLDYLQHFFTIVLSVTVVTGGWSPIFRVFSVLHTIDFVLGSNYTSSRHATSNCFDGLNGTNSNSTKGRCPPMSMVPEVDGGSSSLSKAGLCSWYSPPRSSSSFLLCSSVQSFGSCTSCLRFKAS